MIDNEFKLQLIEINTNPDISLCCQTLSKIIPLVLENVIKLTLDPLFPPPSSNHQRRCQFNQNSIENNKFILLYDSNQDYQQIQKYLVKIDQKIIGDIDDSTKTDSD